MAKEGDKKSSASIDALDSRISSYLDLKSRPPHGGLDFSSISSDQGPRSSAAFYNLLDSFFSPSGDFSEISGREAPSVNTGPIGLEFPLRTSLFDTSCSSQLQDLVLRTCRVVLQNEPPIRVAPGPRSLLSIVAFYPRSWRSALDLISLNRQLPERPF